MINFENATLFAGGLGLKGLAMGLRGGAKGGNAVLRSFTKSNFRHNLGQLTGKLPSNAQAHHVFPQKFADKFAGKVNIHNPKYGAWWETSSHLKNARAYNQAWEQFFIRNPNATSGQILNQGRSLMGRYGIPVGF